MGRYRGSSDQFYYRTLRFRYRDHKENIIRSYRIDTDRETRSDARESAAMRVYAFLVNRGLWINLEDAGLIPSLDNGINGYGKGPNKTNAKKKAAYMVLVRLLKSAGICKEEWEGVVWQL